MEWVTAAKQLYYPMPCRHQMFYFPLSEEDVNENESSAKLVIGVYPRNVAEDVAATLSLPLTDIKTTVSVGSL